MKINRILFPTDFSPCSEAALSTALFHAQVFEADLHILHIVVPGTADMREAFPEPETISQKLHEIAEVRMRATVEKYQDEPFKIVEAVRAGTAAVPMVKRYASEHGIDLIVMGTHGRTGFKHFLLGSVAENIVRTSECPVVTVRAGENVPPVKSVDCIVASVDFSDFSEAVLLTAIDLAQTHKAKLVLTHVIEEYFHPGGVDAAWTGLGDPMNSYREIREKQLTEYAAKASEAGVPAYTKVLTGRAPAEITKTAAEEKADLIVMGTHGYSGIEHLWLGSTTERVVRISETPVFTIKINA